MTNFIPIFPLSTVAYPDEAVNLHIFEPRYIQMIQDIQAGSGLFGIVPVIDQQVQEMGTLLELVEITETYPGGEMDIKTRGLMVFRILDHITELPDKLYNGAIVHYPNNNRSGLVSKQERVIKNLLELHRIHDLEKKYTKPNEALSMYDIAHHAGLSLQEEYELLCLLREDQRQEYMERHFKRIMPQMLDLEQLKKRVERNGHFRKISVDSFD